MDKSLQVNRRLTRAFIQANPVTLVLTPRSKVRTPTGGTKWQEGTPRAPQVMTLIEPPTDPVPTVTADGVERRVNFMLLGRHDAAMERGDVFTHQGRDWEIVEMFYDNGYEKRGMVSGRG